MKPFQVDRHLDTSCPGTPAPQNPHSTYSGIATHPAGNGSLPTRTSFQPSPPRTSHPPERLPALAYSMLKDNALRKKMNELGLSAAGSRQMIERRHQEWVTLWNANCDSVKPKKRSELLHDLDTWEKTMGTRAPTQSRAVTIGAQIKDKDFDGAAWAAKHDNSFKDLIANARRTRSQAEQKASENSEESKPSVENNMLQTESSYQPACPLDFSPVDLTNLPP